MSEPENPEKYLQRRKSQIVKSLRLLAKAKCLVTGRFETGKYSFMTVVIDVLTDKDLMILDYGHDEAINKKLLACSHVVFVTSYNGIKVRFSSEQVKKTNYKGEPVFVVSIPDSVYWLERREYYRVKLPLMDSAHCKISVPGDEPDDPNKTLKFRVANIGLTGLALFVDTESSDLGEIGTELSDCTLVLPEHMAGLKLEIRHQTPVHAEDDQNDLWVGCSFISPTQQFQSMVMQYMQLVERQRKEYER